MVSGVGYVEPSNLHLRRVKGRFPRADVRNARRLIVDTGGQEAVKCAADALSGTGYTLTCLPVHCDATICPDTISRSCEDTFRSLTPKRVLPPKKRSNYARHCVVIIYGVVRVMRLLTFLRASGVTASRHNMHLRRYDGLFTCQPPD